MSVQVFLRLPDRGDTPVLLNLIPKAGEHIDYSGERYLVVSVTHTVESAKTTLELMRTTPSDAQARLKLNQLARYRTSEIRAYSPPSRTRYIR